MRTATRCCDGDCRERPRTFPFFRLDYCFIQYTAWQCPRNRQARCSTNTEGLLCSAIARAKVRAKQLSENTAYSLSRRSEARSVPFVGVPYHDFESVPVRVHACRNAAASHGCRNAAAENHATVPHRLPRSMSLPGLSRICIRQARALMNKICRLRKTNRQIDWGASWGGSAAANGR